MNRLQAVVFACGMSGRKVRCAAYSTGNNPVSFKEKHKTKALFKEKRTLRRTRLWVWS